MDKIPKVTMLNCKHCNELTPHAEDPVTERESATVWHCMICGTERRPPEKCTPNEPAKPIKPLDSSDRGLELSLPGGKI